MLLVVGGISKSPLYTRTFDLVAQRITGQADISSVSPSPVTRLVIYRSLHQVWVYQDTNLVKTYPIAVGRDGWETPTGTYQVRQLIKDPRWIHPITGETIEGGDPKNPLGHYWIGFWTDGKNWIGFHGTPEPGSVGKSESHGCIRMYSQDVEELYHQVKIGTTVTVEP